MKHDNGNQSIIQYREPVYRQVLAHMRRLISSGTFPPGIKFPTNHELAKTLGVPVSTVNMAVRPLVKEGLLLRRQGVGTFVARRNVNPHRIGIYFPADVFANSMNIFAHGVYRQLAEKLEKRGIEHRILIDPRSPAKLGETWGELKEEILRGEIDGLIVPVINYRLWDWLGKLPVPTACVSSGNMPNKVYYDFKSLIDLSLGALSKAGRRRIALLSPFKSNEPPNPDGTKHWSALFMDYLCEKSERLDMEVLTGFDEGGGFPLTTESSAYEGFKRMWGRKSKRPDGVIVMPDSIARGVVAAALEKRVHIPDELMFVFVKNAELDLVCPFPAVFVTGSLSEFAESLIKLVETQRDGQKPEPVFIRHRIENHGA